MAVAPEMKMVVELDVKGGSAAVARSGDTLVVGFRDSLTAEEFDLLRERFQPILDMGIKVFLVEQNVSLAVLRPDEPVPYELAEGV